MDDLTVIMIAEGTEPADEAEQIAAWQHLIDTGLAWRLQGRFGRTAHDLIAQGVCNPAPKSAPTHGIVGAFKGE